MLNVRKLFLYAALMGCGALQAQEVEIEYERQRAPRYPLSLYEQGISGLAVVEFNTDRDGSITDVKVIDSSHERFAKTAEWAIPQWRPNLGRSVMPRRQSSW